MKRNENGKLANIDYTLNWNIKILYKNEFVDFYF